MVKKGLFDKVLQEYKKEEHEKLQKLRVEKCWEEHNNLLKRIKQEILPGFYQEIKAEIKRDFESYLKSIGVKSDGIEGGDVWIKALKGRIQLIIERLEDIRKILKIKIMLGDKNFEVFVSFKGLEHNVKIDIGVGKSIYEIQEEECKEEVNILNKILSGNYEIVYILKCEGQKPPMVRKKAFWEILEVVNNNCKN